MRRRNAIKVKNTPRRRVRCSGIRKLRIIARVRSSPFGFAQPHPASLATPLLSSALCHSARLRSVLTSSARFHTTLCGPACPLLRHVIVITSMLRLARAARTPAQHFKLNTTQHGHLTLRWWRQRGGCIGVLRVWFALAR